MKRKLSIVVGIIGIILIFAVHTRSACDPMTYWETQSAEFHQFCGYGSVYLKDNNVWVFNEESRKRFGMPPEWQDDGLKGAELVAFRIEPSGRQRCHGAGQERNCVPSYECVLEMYINSDIDIGNTGNPAMGFIPWKSSLFTLGKRNPELAEKWERTFGLKNTQLLVSGHVQEGGVKTISYDTTQKKNLTIVTMFIDGRATLLSPEIPRSIRFPVVSKGFHTVELPPSFWQRVIGLHRSLPDIDERNWRGGDEQDNSLWVYTADFAKRYHMPPSGISKELEGALAVAYQLIPTGRPSCGYFSDASNCTGSRVENIFDMYIDHSIKLPYRSYDGLARVNPGDSALFLREQNYRNKIESEQSKWNLEYRANFIYRSSKRARENSDKWYGWDGGYFRKYVDNTLWGIDFSLVGLKLRIGDSIHAFEQNFLGFVDFDRWAGKKEFFQNTIHVIHFPHYYLKAIIEYDDLHNSDSGSVIGIIRGKYDL
ncbi:hypothetical protein [Desulfofustis limnaeus]|uniref:Uncharacterized protein n=1 Tax=Desulfofustis limnaeus TaxID=2740163 RepID=A0ABM7W9N1_9BACT|nr:hypothetical protein [Desulfofustis limnaeus]BDD87694.1 hypothetical protein DPPLL_20590 [Desulfofustis limnaeus]